MKQEPDPDCAMGTERTGTTPFMAVELLTQEYWDGLIKREYHHELEAFIWILVFVCLRYRDGKAFKGSPVDEWMTANYMQCAVKKSYFWQRQGSLQAFAKDIDSDFQVEWMLTCDLLVYHARANHLHIDAQMGNLVRDAGHKPDISSSQKMWESFIDILEKAARQLKLDYLVDLIRDLGLKTVFPPDERENLEAY